jgi:hypothetical protein
VGYSERKDRKKGGFPLKKLQTYYVHPVGSAANRLIGQYLEDRSMAEMTGEVRPKVGPPHPCYVLSKQTMIDLEKTRRDLRDRQFTFRVFIYNDAGRLYDVTAIVMNWQISKRPAA